MSQCEKCGGHWDSGDAEECLRAQVELLEVRLATCRSLLQEREYREHKLKHLLAAMLMQHGGGLDLDLSVYAAVDTTMMLCREDSPDGMFMRLWVTPADEELASQIL